MQTSGASRRENADVHLLFEPIGCLRLNHNWSSRDEALKWIASLALAMTLKGPRQRPDIH
jgi:hypothetical protein